MSETKAKIAAAKKELVMILMGGLGIHFMAGTTVLVWALSRHGQPSQAAAAIGTALVWVTALLTPRL